jgi:hypothetical protein
MKVAASQIVPSAWDGEPTSVATIESAFADELDALMLDEISAQDAVCGWERASVLEATRLQDLAASYTHIPASSEYYRVQSDDMWEEACTWRLVRCMFCR